MAIATKLKNYLDRKGIEYELVPHPYANSSMLTAEVAHISGDQIAKSVMLEDEQGFLIAVIPATHYVEFSKLRGQLDRQLGLATEKELAGLFDDCDVGAVPPLGEAYGLKVVLDESLKGHKDIFFEAGDHLDLVHVSGKDFQALMSNVEHGYFTQHI